MALIGTEGVAVGTKVTEQVYSFGGTFPAPRGRLPLPNPGTISRLRIQVATNTLDGDLVISVMVNGVIKKSITIGATVTGDFKDDFSEVVADQDKVSFKVDAGAATTGGADHAESVRYDPSS